jgi:hypothetical protein
MSLFYFGEDLFSCLFLSLLSSLLMVLWKMVMPKVGLSFGPR